MELQGSTRKFWSKDHRGNEISTPNLSSQTLWKRFCSGMGTIVIDNVQKSVPEIGALLCALSREIYGQKSNDDLILCNGYANKAHSGSAMHFDNHEVLVIHLIGKKRWRFAPCGQIKNPHVAYKVGTECDRELSAILREPFPAKMPMPYRTVTLRPGSVLFLPRGYWHATLAIEDCLALTLSFRATTIAQLLATNLLKMLHRQEAWREPVNSYFADPTGELETIKVLMGSVERFKATVTKMGLADLLDD